MNRKVKIICTIGPATSGEENLKRLISSGMDAARLNFSHGTHEQHAENIEEIRKASASVGKQAAIIQDLPGPKIRTGKVEGGEVFLETGAEFTLTTEPMETGNAEKAGVNYPNLAKEIKKGGTILLDDGYIILKAVKISGSEILTEVVKGGALKNNKGVVAPGSTSKAPAITEKCLDDLKFGLAHGVDAVALSFVSAKKDIIELRSFMRVYGRAAPVISKIERGEAYDNIDEIISESDMIMVARGDLGLELPAEEVPVIQKEIISKCNRAGKPVITATQMLESMIKNPRPTRAEASDVANAVLDGTDCVMLSAETSVGDYPFDAVEYMDKIICSVEERSPAALRKDYGHISVDGEDISDALGNAACILAEKVSAKAIVAFTGTGYTPQNVAKYRPAQQIIAMTGNESAYRALSLVWGVKPVLLSRETDAGDIFESCIGQLENLGALNSGDYAVFVAGLTEGNILPGNMLKVYRV